MVPLSVLIPCFNAEATLENAFASLQSQTWSDFEVVAVNDGSTDHTAALLRDWSKRDPRFRTLTQPHGGIVAALNAGLATCKAPYIARMDVDDHAHPQRLARQMAYLDAHPDVTVVGCRVRGMPPGAVQTGFQIYIEWINSLLTDEDIRREIFVESPFVHPSVIFRREEVLRLGGYQDHGWAEDYDLWLRLYIAGARFGKVSEILLDWHESPNRLTRTDNRYSLENFLRAKAHYLARGPLIGRDAVFIWGAGMTGRRLSKHLLRQKLPLTAFIDIDPRKIGRTRRGRPILAPDNLLAWWAQYDHPVLLAAVGARGAKPLIRERLAQFDLREGLDWWNVA